MENPFETPQVGGSVEEPAVQSLNRRIFSGLWLLLAALLYPIAIGAVTAAATYFLRPDQIGTLYYGFSILGLAELAVRVVAAFRLTDASANRQPLTVAGALRVVAVFSILTYFLSQASQPLETYGAESMSLIAKWITRMVSWGFVALILLRLDQIARMINPRLARGRLILVLYFVATALSFAAEKNPWDNQWWLMLMQAGLSMAAWILGLLYLIRLIIYVRRTIS